MVVRGAARGGDECGFYALKLLLDRFNPKTPAKLFKTQFKI